MEQKKITQKVDLKYVFMERAGFIFRLRMWMASKLIPARASQAARAWVVGIPVVVKEKEHLNRAQRRAK
jgi:hypothetical protein